MVKKQRIKSSTSDAFSAKLRELAAQSEHNPLDTLNQAQHLLQDRPEHTLLLTIAANAARVLGYSDLAVEYADRVLTLEPDSIWALRIRANIETEKQDYSASLPFLERAIAVRPNDEKTISSLLYALLRLKRYDDFFIYFERFSSATAPDGTWLNNYGQALLETGQIDEALVAYQKAREATPSLVAAHANCIVTLHYHSNHTPEKILAECLRFQDTFRPKGKVQRAKASNLDPRRTIRIGMISDGFRAHPVGSMITHGLKHVPRSQIELFAYSTNNKSDHITESIKNICEKWERVDELSDDELNDLIRQDKIDILFDLCGYNNNTRTTAIMLEPAPIIIKWVGGLISSTGIDAIDYLLSDRIQTPAESDSIYTEKLIRLPDDYICFEPPLYSPPVGELPVARNGYVTFGCFNNASKINDILLDNWAHILNALPNSRIFLKSQGYSSKQLCNRVKDFFISRNISEERVRIESGSPHRELLESYNDVDIALDPWPYSGGLTTCEALIMGVPVITLPGPVFSGRHSATHLVNAGMPELVAQNWEQYHNLAVSLANDLENLQIIRQNLRAIVLQSPLCDAPRFGQSFNNAMRAVWQRHCAGKSPEALVLSNEQIPYFADESGPVDLLQPIFRTEDNNDEAINDEISDAGPEFSFSFSGRIVVVDNGTSLPKGSHFFQWKASKAFQFILFDPAGAINKESLPIDVDQSIRLLPFHVLGDGEKATLYACVDQTQSSTLQPLPASNTEQDESESPAHIIAEVPINTVRLDGISGLTRVDWLLLNGRHTVTTILSADAPLAKNALIVQINSLTATEYQGQPPINSLIVHMTGLDFDSHQIDINEKIKNTLAINKNESVYIFIPNKRRLQGLSQHERERLAFILHAVYGMHDLAYYVFASTSPDRARLYLETIDEAKISSLTESSEVASKKKTSVIEKSIDVKIDGDPLVNYNWKINEKIHVVDIGANPIDGTPPYSQMLDEGKVSLIGFEPQKDALRRLQQMKGENETYFPYAIGDGKEATLYICKAPGMTSTLEPNFDVLNHFQGYPVWAEVTKKEKILTKRLNEISEITTIDWLKIDIQGGEVNVFENGDKKLKDTLVIQTEANFIQLYKNQPLFSDIDQWMRRRGFMLHTLLEVRKRLYAPLTIGGQIHNGLNQITTADAVYIPSLERISSLSKDQRTKLAYILYKAYGSVDLAYRIINSMLEKEDSPINNVSSEIDGILKSIRSE